MSLALYGVSLVGLWATEEHVLTVFQPLATSPEIEIREMTYVTWFGALEESTVAAVSWPALLDSPHPKHERQDLNLASLLGIKTQLAKDQEGTWRVTVDLSKLKPLPKDFAEERLDEELGRAEILQKVLEAIRKNLQKIGVFDCSLRVLGAATQEDLKELTFPQVWNRADEVWGKWRYKHLRRRFADGDLQHLAAQSLSNADALNTLFLIASSESWSPDAKGEMSHFLSQLLARLGDERFGGLLENSEEEVQARILDLLAGAHAPATRSPGEAGVSQRFRAFFPKTFAVKSGG